MSIRWEFHAASAFPTLAGRWDALNQRAGNLPFQDSRFIGPLLKHFGDGKQLIALATDGADTVAGGILQPGGLGRWTSFQPSQMPLGPWLATASAWQDADLLPALARSLPGFCAQLGLTQLDPHILARPEDNANHDSLDYIQTAWVDIDSDFDTYWNARGKNLRTNMRKQRTKLETDGVQIGFQTLTATTDMEAALNEYGRLESAGWKAGAGTAVNADNAQGRFYTEMMQAFCADGRGKIWRLMFGDKVVAVDLCIEAGDTLVVLKTAYDPEFKAVSPAFILRQDAFKELFDAGRIRRIEFYGRLMEWHTRWTENSRTLYHHNHYRWALVKTLKQRLRPAPGVTEGDAESTSSAH
ncbi:GNAT family N-acetyltransferase [Uliginosibacterium sp. H1]|uniref:GNAT family N-acetyltransferase n=1 Tax=Uliginosibacterium sp. H1 TaxID=3114757 RepID=UPI002E184EA1|nr:GNAT family N-acetyltransferase [Uliginosibacterium sp. H1]